MSIDVTDHPLYDLAVEYAVNFTPKDMPLDAQLTVAQVQTIMAIAWLEGVNWGVTHPMEAAAATAHMGLKMQAGRAV